MYRPTYTGYGCLNPRKYTIFVPDITGRYWIPQNSAETEIPQKWVNSTAGLKIPHSTENCGPWLLPSFSALKWLVGPTDILALLSYTRRCNSHFSGKSGLAGSPLILSVQSFLYRVSFWDRLKVFVSSFWSRQVGFPVMYSRLYPTHLH